MCNKIINSILHGLVYNNLLKRQVILFCLALLYHAEEYAANIWLLKFFFEKFELREIYL